MWHTIFITLHAVAGGLALLAGCVAIRGHRLFPLYLWSLVAMEVFLVLALVVEWTRTAVGLRVLFTALAALGLYLIWRAVSARRILPAVSATPSLGYVNHVGFTLVALFDAFVVILVLDLGAPVWLVAVGAVGIALTGHLAVRAARHRFSRAPGTHAVA